MDVNELSRIIRAASQLSTLDNILFSDLVAATSQYRVLPIDEKNPQDQELIQLLVKSANKYIALVKRRNIRLRSDRINDVGKNIEEVFLEELKKTELQSVELLGSSGYPDMKIIDSYGRVVYIESKVVSKDWDSTQRSFYYTSGKKINSDGHHLLIAWDLLEEDDKYWAVTGWKLCDLSKLPIKVKIEFNSSNRAIYQEDSILAASKV
jgi:hypothetical protein